MLLPGVGAAVLPRDCRGGVAPTASPPLSHMISLGKDPGLSLLTAASLPLCNLGAASGMSPICHQGVLESLELPSFLQWGKHGG